MDRDRRYRSLVCRIFLDEPVFMRPRRKAIFDASVVFAKARQGSCLCGDDDVR